MFDLVHRHAPESTRARIGLTLAASLLTTICITLVFISHGPVVPVLVCLGGLSFAVMASLGVGLARQAEAAPAEANPAWEPRQDGDADTDPVGTLQQRYAEGKVDDEEFERRMNHLLESDDRRVTTSEGTASGRSRSVERATE